MRLHHLALAALTAAVHTSSAFQIAPARNVKNTWTKPTLASASTGTALYGKLWDKLQIEPDTMEDDPAWYVMNCVAGCEQDLLGQAKHVTRDMSLDLIEKIVVPTERKLRSHGKTKKVVEVKVMYPGYVFVKMRACAETYEPLQELLLCRSWMAGTVNKKGYKKLPPAPICLSDEEVSKFNGLEEQTAEMYEKFGEDYTGRGDSGDDLLAQYEGYEVDNMVKVLSGNFKGEDGVVKRLKDGQIMLRLFTYGNVIEQWFNMDEVRIMTDVEAMKGLKGPTHAVTQDEFDVSIGKEPKKREDDRGERGERVDFGGKGERNRKQDRTERGERSSKDMTGSTAQEIKEEEQNWRQFREEQRAKQEQKRGDMWGIKERSSMDAGDNAASFNSDGQWKSGRENRKDNNKREASQEVADAVSGDGNWDLFSSDAQNASGSGAEDDFFTSLMSELSDNLDSPGSSGGAKDVASSANVDSADDDFFTSLMSELSETVDESPPSQQSPAKSSKPASKSFDDDDFFASLEADLSESLNDGKAEVSSGSSGEDDFFASLESDLSESLGNSREDKNAEEDSFFGNLENNLSKALSEDNAVEKGSDEDDFFAKESAKAKGGNSKDLSKLTVAGLKEMLKERGLKVSGKKNELIERLQES